MKLPLKRLVFYLGLLILSIWILSVYFHFKGNVLYVYTRIAEIAKESPSTTNITERVPRQRTTPQNIREFTSMKFGPIFIFGVAAGNTSHKSRWDVFKIYGSLDEKAYGDYNLTCCFKYSSADGDFFQSASPLVRRYYYCRPRLWSYYLACPNKLSLDGFIPTGAAVTFGNYSCGENDVTYVEPYFPYKEPNKIAIGTKLAFANISAEIIIEWMESYKYLGVDKVVTYYLRNINKDALKVLEYYQSTGIMDLSYFEPAFEAKYPRVEKFAKQGTQVYNDQQVVVDDSFERYSGYEYFGIIDFDEFFVPGRYKTLRETLKALSKIYKNPAGFTTLSRYYYTTWGRSSNRSDLILQRYIQREDRKPALECQKNIYTPRRIAYGKVHTHRIGAKEGYKMYVIDEEFGYIHHFRSCRKRHMDRCNATRILDTVVSDWAEAFRGKVIDVRRKVLDPS